MVERCARAVHAIQFEDKEQAEHEWHHFSGAQEYSQKLARAVIEALMDPTPEMIDAAVHSTDFAENARTRLWMRRAYRSALRTALSQPNEGK